MLAQCVMCIPAWKHVEKIFFSLQPVCALYILSRELEPIHGKIKRIITKLWLNCHMPYFLFFYSLHSRSSHGRIQFNERRYAYNRRFSQTTTIVKWKANQVLQFISNPRVERMLLKFRCEIQNEFCKYWVTCSEQDNCWIILTDDFLWLILFQSKWDSSGFQSETKKKENEKTLWFL